MSAANAEMAKKKTAKTPMRITRRARTSGVPHVEAPHVKLDTQTSRRADPFHDKLRFGDNFLAGVTRLAVASTAPEARDTVLG
jgi:hypothetical protein